MRKGNLFKLQVTEIRVNKKELVYVNFIGYILYYYYLSNFQGAMFIWGGTTILESIKFKNNLPFDFPEISDCCPASDFWNAIWLSSGRDVWQWLREHRGSKSNTEPIQRYPEILLNCQIKYRVPNTTGVLTRVGIEYKNLWQTLVDMIFPCLNFPSCFLNGNSNKNKQCQQMPVFCLISFFLKFQK